MLRTTTVALFLFFTTSLALQAMPEPKTKILPGGVHTYVWEQERQSRFDRIELRLVIPVGLVHEKGHESGSCAALCSTLEMHWHGLRFPTPIYSDVSLDSTIFEVQLPYKQLDRLPEIFNLFAQWTWSWTPQESRPFPFFWRDPSSQELAMAAYAGRGDSAWPSSLPIDDTLTEFYNLTYRSLPIAVIAAGEFDADWVEGLIADAFANPPSGDLGPLPEANVHGKWPKQVELNIDYDPLHYGSSDLEVHVSLGAHHVTYTPRQEIVREMLAMYLCKQFGRFIDHEFIDTRNCSFFCLDFECGPLDLVPTLERLDEELSDIAEKGISKKELESLRRSLEALLSLLSYADFDAEDLADSCVDHFRGVGSLQNADLVTAVQRAVATVTSEEIGAYASSLLPLSRGRIFIEVSASPNEAGTIESLQAELEELFTS